MRTIFFLLLFSVNFLLEVNAQWQTIPKSIDTYQWTPYRQFIINPFLNQMWFVTDTRAVVLENDGTFIKFSDIELGSLWSGDQIQFAFTPNHIYYARDFFGLYSFDGYLSQEEYAFTGYQGKIRNSGGESVFILQVEPNTTYVEFNEAFVDTPYRGAYNMAVKNNFMYVSFSSYSNIAYFTTPGTSDIVYIHTDPDYVGGNYNEMKFSRLTDSLFVAGKNGISFAYNYDFLDSITPNNTTGMPSANVLEIEFDQNDRLWAVFGDATDTPFGLAKLEGSTWTNFYDSNNSPIDFSTFYGLEIDTLGNVWVVDGSALHTLLTPNSPTWLGLQSLDKASPLLIQPNPVSESLTISGYSEALIGNQAILLDLSGKTIMGFTLNAMQYNLDVSSLKSGLYLLKINSYTEKIIIK